MTEADLLVACDSQRELLALAITTQDIFEAWAGSLLKKHFEKVLGGATSRSQSKWDEDITLGRSSDIYGLRGESSKEGAPAPKNASVQLNRRAEYLEFLVWRYFSILSATRRMTAVHNFRMCLDVPDGTAADTLEARLHQGSQEEEAARAAWRANPRRQKTAKADSDWDVEENLWTPNALAKAFFGALSWRYISTVADFVQKDDPIASAVRNLTETARAKIGEVIKVNHPGQIHLARQAFRPELGHDLDELISAAMEATSNSAQRYHPLCGRGGFITYTQKAIRSSLRRSTIKTRVISVPEKKLMALSKLNTWKGRNIIAAETLPLAEQMRLADIRDVGVDQMTEIIAEEASTQALSVDALAESATETASEAASLTSSLLTDGGRGAVAIREASGGDRRLALMRPAFQKLHPLHQALLACLHPCAVTDGGEFAWFDHLQKVSEDLVQGALQRIRTGIASPNHVAVSLNTRY